MDRQKNTKEVKKEVEQEDKAIDLTEKLNPFLTRVIVEKILTICKSTSPDIKSFSSLRLICKLWDIECTKILRPDTQIPLSRILNPYPNGLGWAWNRRYRTTGQEYLYKCPLPPTKPFENIQINATCKNSSDRQVIQWLNVMGDQLKSLHFISPLHCYHQNDFLGDILHKFCPNLETLHLDSIKCFPSLLQTFEGRATEFRNFHGTSMNCGNLKNLTISVEADLFRRDCRRKQTQLPVQSHHDDRNTLYRILNDFKSRMDALPEKDSTSFGNQFYQLIETGDSDIFAQIAKKYYPEMHGIDLGILGLILKAAPLQKLVIKQLAHIRQSEELAMFLLFHSSNVRNTLVHLEFNNALLDTDCLKILSLMKFPLSTLRLDKIDIDAVNLTYLQDVIKTFADTLTNLEIGSEDKHALFTGDFLDFPPLPKLTSFTNNSVVWLPVSGNSLFENAPSLRKCFIRNHDSSIEINSEIGTRVMSIFCANASSSLEIEGLEELVLKMGVSGNFVEIKIKTELTSFKVAFEHENPLEMVMNGVWDKELQNLVSINLTIAEGMEKVFPETRMIHSNFIEKFLETCEYLETFELQFAPVRKGLMASDLFTDGFAKLPYLTYLTFSNVFVGTDDVEDFQSQIAHIPYITLSNVTYISMQEFEAKVESQE